METNNVEQSIFNALLEIPYTFSAGDRRFSLYPVTLGKDMLLKQYVRALEEMSGKGAENLQQMALRAVFWQKGDVLRIISLYTLCRKEDLLDEDVISGRIVDLDSRLENEEIAALLVICLESRSDAASLMRDSGLEAQRENMRTLQKVKKQNPNCIPFGGLTVYGRLVDVACERYGWTLEYVLWGISLTNLQMMLADQMTSVFLTKEELKELNSDDEEIDADDPDSRGQLHEMLGG